MISVPNLVQLIKKAALDAVNESKPTSIVFGQVINIDPLKIQVDQKLILTSDQLILTTAAMDHEVNMTIDSINKTVMIHNALILGDQVLMIQVQGGQKFIVMERQVII